MSDRERLNALRERVLEAIVIPEKFVSQRGDEWRRHQQMRAVFAVLGFDDWGVAVERLWDHLARQGMAQDRVATEVADDALATEWRTEFSRALLAALTPGR